MHSIELESALVAVKKDLLLLLNGLKGNVVFVFFLLLLLIVEVSLLMDVHRIDSTFLLYLLKKLEVSKANLHSEIILLIIGKLNVSFFLCFSKLKLLFTLYDTIQLHLEFLFLRHETYSSPVSFHLL